MTRPFRLALLFSCVAAACFTAPALLLRGTHVAEISTRLVAISPITGLKPRFAYVTAQEEAAK